MRIAVAGKGGSGKTTIAGTLSRILAGAGRSVLAVDADTNPNLGISLGLGPERTFELVAARQAIDEEGADHAHTVAEVIDRFGTDTVDGIRLVQVSRIDQVDPGCP